MECYIILFIECQEYLSFHDICILDDFAAPTTLSHDEVVCKYNFRKWQCIIII